MGLPHVIAPPRKPPRQDMGHRAKAYADMHGFYRGREEHLYGLLWPFALFRGKFRGRGVTGEHRLWARMKVLLNFFNFAIRRRVLYEPMGPWGHFPDIADDIATQDEDIGEMDEDLNEEEIEDLNIAPIVQEPLQRAPRKVQAATRLTRQQEADRAAEMGLSSQQLFSLRND